MKEKDENKIRRSGRKEIKFSGFGGQGIILSAVITGRATAIYDKKNSVVTESYGPEARGGACAGSVVVDEKPIDYPYVTTPDVLVVMSQEAYTAYKSSLKTGGIIIIDEDLVKLDKEESALVYRIPATRFAEEIGKKIVANIAMLGFFTGITDITKYESMKRAVLDSVPPHTKDINERVFEKGYNYSKLP
jgi:2-oxoglutarate ferredoxin oxidoreductase subunit gamma